MSAAGEDDDDDMDLPQKVKDDREWQEANANADAPIFVTDGRRAKDAGAVLEKADAPTLSTWLRCENATEWREAQSAKNAE
jgi:hypothetical protein